MRDIDDESVPERFGPTLPDQPPTWFFRLIAVFVLGLGLLVCCGAIVWLATHSGVFG